MFEFHTILIDRSKRHTKLSPTIYGLGQQYEPRVQAKIVADNSMCMGTKIHVATGLRLRIIPRTAGSVLTNIKRQLRISKS